MHSSGCSSSREKADVLNSQGSLNRSPQSGQGFKQQILTCSHSPGSWKSKVRALSGLGPGDHLLPGHHTESWRGQQQCHPAACNSSSLESIRRVVGTGDAKRGDGVHRWQPKPQIGSDHPGSWSGEGEWKKRQYCQDGKNIYKTRCRAAKGDLGTRRPLSLHLKEEHFKP